MSGFEPLGLGRTSLRRREPGSIEHTVTQRPLHRILAFTGFSIDDVVNNPVARNTVRGYFKLYKQIERVSDIVDLERQWNAVEL